MKKYLKIWVLMTSNSFQAVLSSRFGMVVFIFGKLFRFGIYLSFIYFLFSATNGILGYNRNQTLLFLLTFTFLGSVGQMFLREVYRFRGKVVSGEFDFDLLKPVHPLLRNLAGGFDLLDLLTMPVFIYVLVKIISQLHFGPGQLALYVLLSLNGLLIMTAIHIVVAAFGIITTEVDHMLMVYRDLETMGRFPVDIYKEPLRQILTFALPIGVMFTFPAKALLGLLSWQMVVIAIGVGFLSVYLAIRFWNFAVGKYSSASS